ncbi:ketoacyl-ACP synthase III [Streptomyces carminius]|uniref:Ketoacyl-ACP synthase III n=1 Tax=Streptomyces carminius TaxID=2665496 RepID=A0A2M8LSI2_9ACTN|nr:ketoacyl-ACP synthase III [Streptomyces carminius]PJE94913.1 ketoacyl-ACP synthase III [Streptomyces carminius]
MSDTFQDDHRACGPAVRSAGPRWARHGLAITGTGHYYPRRLVHNDGAELTRQGSAASAAVLGRVAVRSRHVSDEQESVPFMASAAVTGALRHAGLRPADVDLLILSNWTTPPYMPEYAPQVADRIGAGACLAFDVSAACAGFVHGVQLAAGHFVAMPEIRTAVVVAAEQFSRRARPGSKGELVCGDAAGAVVLERSGRTGTGLLDSVLASDGSRSELVTVRMPEAWITSKPDLPEHAAAGLLRACEELLDRNGLTPGDIDWWVPHPGTDLVHERLRASLGVPHERFAFNFHDRANTASASIPTVLSEFVEAGLFRPGHLVLAPAIGSGWYHGALLFRL